MTGHVMRTFVDKHKFSADSTEIWKRQMSAEHLRRRATDDDADWVSPDLTLT